LLAAGLKTRRVGLFIDGLAQPTICFLFFGGAGFELNLGRASRRRRRKTKNKEKPGGTARAIK
jgi:hypothetical protein